MGRSSFTSRSTSIGVKGGDGGRIGEGRWSPAPTLRGFPNDNRCPDKGQGRAWDVPLDASAGAGRGDALPMDQWALKQGLPELPPSRGQDIDAQPEVGHGVTDEAGQDALGPVEEPRP